MEPTRNALIVANDVFVDPGLRQLRAPAHDAEALAEVLSDPEIGAFEVATVLNRPAHEVDRAVEQFFADRSPDDLLLMHFSGHGVKDENGDLFFAAADTDLGLLGATAVSAEFVNRLMSRTRSRRVVLLLDCCYAGAFEKGLSTRGDTDLHLGERLAGRGRAVITASTAMEYAFEGSDPVDMAGGEPSVFTSAVVEALRTGEADTDQDGLIGLNELYDYVYDKVRSVTPSQTPSKWTLGFQGELYLARRSRPVSEPTPLPEELTDALSSPLPSVRAAALDELGTFVRGTHAGRSLAARQALEQLVGDDSRRVAAAAAALLAQAPDVAPPRIPTSRTAPEVESAPEVEPAPDVEPEPKPEPEPKSEPEPKPEPEPKSEPTRRWGRGAWAAVVATALLVVAGGVWALVSLGNGGGGGGGGSGGGGGGGAAAAVPDTSIVVAIGDGEPVRGELAEVDTEGGGVSRIGSITDARLPTIAPDRRSIVYLTGPDGKPVPRLVQADGNGDEPFLTGASGCTSSDRPAWSPDGSQIAIVCDSRTPAALLLLNADRSLARVLPTSSVPKGSPTWIENDGVPGIVFIQQGDQAHSLTLAYVDPSRPDDPPTPLTAGPDDTHPDGASDTLLFLRSGSSAQQNLGTAVVKTEKGVGQGEEELSGLGELGSPTWSPDGQSMTFLRDGSLWIASADGGQPERLDVGGTAGAPAWGSR